MINKINLSLVKITISLLYLFGFNTYAQEANPRYSFFDDGETPSAWQWVLSDPKNWWLPISNNTGTSEGGKITITPSEDVTFSGAIKLEWNKSTEYGAISIAGMTTNLAPYEEKAELLLAVKLEKRGGYTSIKMGCGENCEGTVNITDQLTQAKLNTWFALAVPLDCFSGKGIDFSKITQPFSIGTDSSMILHIAEIRVTAMKDDDQGCIPHIEKTNN